ncbi:hypothetical protein GGF43_002752 [Coemansia sp. RSA 2618]|nr:hypothetical protein GGF43_002752 [Coemansia sp. RSA 2618]
MTPMVVSSVVDAINSRDSYGLRQMMVQNMASTYNSALEQMSKQGYSIDIAVHDMSNVKFGGLSVKLGPPNAFNTSINIDERRKRFMYSAAGSHMFAYNKDPSSSALSTIAQSMSPTEVAQRPVQIEFWSTVQARVAVSLSRRGKVVDKDEGYMPIVLSLASPIYPSVLSTPTIYADGRVDDDETGIKFQWRVSDLFLRATNDEADAISRSSKKLKI